jgi:hypothetical protein
LRVPSVDPMGQGPFCELIGICDPGGAVPGRNEEADPARQLRNTVLSSNASLSAFPLVERIT